MAETRAIEALKAFLSDLNQQPSLERLRGIRNVLDRPAFLQNLLVELRGTNDPAVLEEHKELLVNLRRLVEERAQQRKRYKEIIQQLGLGGGIAVSGGGLLGLAAATIFAPAAVLLVFSGLAIIGVGVAGASYVDEERVLYEHIAERMKVLVEKAEGSA